ncbi:MAG: hypothetical protein ACRDQZ_03465 [Mycobacteriales bacterium]
MNAGLLHFYDLFRQCDEQQQRHFIRNVIWPEAGHRGEPTEREVGVVLARLRRAADRAVADGGMWGLRVQ